MAKIDKYAVRRAGVHALAAGIGAATGYAAAKGMHVPVDAMHGLIQSDYAIGGGILGTFGSMMGMHALGGRNDHFDDGANNARR
jgi:hypothetical protein